MRDGKDDAAGQEGAMLFLVKRHDEPVAGPIEAESPERWMVATYGRFWRGQGYAVVELTGVSALMQARRPDGGL